MKAKDYCPQHGYSLPCAKCGLGEYEAGKKAGMKEVVEWINTHIADAFPYAKEEWQAKLKEWGIE